jgi:hypothetical protein
MALTLTSSPSGLAFIKNGVRLEWSSDLFPINTVDSARSILADGYTAGGQYYVEVTTAATELIVGRWVRFFFAGNVTAEARILAVSTPSNRRLVLNIDRPSAGSTVQRFYKDYGVEVEMQYEQPVGAGYETISGIRSALLEQDLASYLASVWQPYTLGQLPDGRDKNAIYYRFRFREVYEGFTGTYSAYSTPVPALNGGLQIDQTLSQFTLDGVTKRFMTNRPLVSYGVAGIEYTLPMYATTAVYVDGALTGNFQQPGLAITQDEVTYQAVVSQVNTTPLSIPYRIFPNPFLCSEALTIGWINPYGRSDAYTFVGRQTERKTSAKAIAMKRYNTALAPVVNTGVLRNYQRLQQIVDKEIVYTVGSGYVTREMLEWLSEIVHAEYVWIQEGANVYPILVTTGEVTYADTAAKTFEITLSYVKSVEVIA